MEYVDGKTKKMLIILIAVIIIFIVGALVINLIKGNTLSYEKIENKLSTVAKKYCEENKNILPTTDEDTLEINDSLLVENKYMKKLSEYQKDKNATCTGKILVTKSGDYYNYSPYLNCGDKYTTKYLYEKLLEDIVEKDDGLYKMSQYVKNNETEDFYVYKGDYVNNYVEIDKGLWRIVKMDSNHNIMLTQEYVSDDTLYSTVWDDRYNKMDNSNSGINNYYKSIIRNYIKNIYDGKTLSDDLKSKIVSKDLCVGVRKETDTLSNNKIECSNVIEGDYLGMLTVSDFMSASLSTECKTTMDISCSNYNYLTKFPRQFWLLTASTEKSYEGYAAYNLLYTSTLSNESTARISLYITANTLFRGGTGTESDPYTIK